jgi:DNA-binding MarR family transcriptional regulator
MSSSFKRAFSEIDLEGLTPHQARTLGFIEGNEASGVNQRDIADATGTRAASISSLLQGLERDGWIVRRTDPEDSRRKTVHVTAKARNLVRRFEAGVWAGSELSLAGLSPDEQTELIRLLTKLDASLSG